MSRVALILAFGASLAVAANLAAATRADPHLDTTLVLSGCAACHVGHGVARSPMLPAPQSKVCLGCHGTEANLARQRTLGNISVDARPPSLSRVLDQPFVHTMTRGALSGGRYRAILRPTSLLGKNLEESRRRSCHV